MSQYALHQTSAVDSAKAQAVATERAEASRGLQLRDTMAGIRATDLQLAALDQALLQFRAAVAERNQDSDAHAIAAQGMVGGGGALPHLETIQRAFGRHDVSNVQAHTGGAASRAAQQLGAHAYAADGAVVLGDNATDLHTVAHEAAHVVQQRGGVQLKGGVGEIGDRYEQHADAVADAVVSGNDAEGLLDRFAPASGATAHSVGAGGAIQRLGRIPLMGWKNKARGIIESFVGRPAAKVVATEWLDGDGLTGFNTPEMSAVDLTAQLESILAEADQGENEMVQTGRAVHETLLPAGGTLSGDLSGIAEPVNGAQVFPGAPETIRVTLNGEHDLELRASQSYLCTETCVEYRADAGDIKPESFELTRWNNATSEREVYVVGGGHHRLVWLLYHGLSPTVTLNHSKTIAGQVWDMTYRPRPGKMRVKEITDVASVGESLFRTYVSPTKEAQDLKKGGDDLATFVRAYCTKKKLDCEPCLEDLLGLLRDHLESDFCGLFPEVVETLASRCEDDETAQRYREVMLESADQLSETPVVLSSAESGGDFDLLSRVVILDPSLSPREQLDCLAFEMQNAKLADRLSTVSHSQYGNVADVEFESDFEYVEVLKRVYEAGDYEELAAALKLDEFLEDAPSGDAVAMPSKTDLPEADRRKALWWYKTRNWSNKAKQAAWAKSSHSDGMKSSEQEYSGHKKITFGDL